MLSHVIKLSKYSNYYYDIIYIFHVLMSYIFNIIRLICKNADRICTFTCSCCDKAEKREDNIGFIVVNKM